MPKTTHDIVRHGWVKYICVFSSFQAQTHVQQENCNVVRSSSEGKQNVPLHQRSAVAYLGNPATSPWAVDTAGAIGGGGGGVGGVGGGGGGGGGWWDSYTTGTK